MDDITPDGSVKPSSAYKTSYANTLRGLGLYLWSALSLSCCLIIVFCVREWGYSPLATSNYSWGSQNLFESDCWAPPPTTVDVCPEPKDNAGSAKFFEVRLVILRLVAWSAMLIGR